MAATALRHPIAISSSFDLPPAQAQVVEAVRAATAAAAARYHRGPVFSLDEIAARGPRPLYNKLRRDRLRAQGRCINGPIDPNKPTIHGPVVRGGKCQRCLDVHAESEVMP
jgi:hypothetical protein